MPDKPEKPARKRAGAKPPEGQHESKAPRKRAPGAEADMAAGGAEKEHTAPAGATAGNAAHAADAPQDAGQSAHTGGHRQVKVGRVVSNKMDKTVIVAVENTATHRLYHRSMKRTSKFAAHDADNRCQIGDQVAIISSRPLSKTKRWRVREVLKRAD